MHLAINAVPIQVGGGLTVVRGLLHSLRQIHPEWRITVFTGSCKTHESILSLDCADRVEHITGPSGSLASFRWQNSKLGERLQENNTDAFVTFNHYLSNISCPQIVYHLNLRRFCKVYRSRNPIEILKEFLRDRSARRALSFAHANVFESHYLQKAAETLLKKLIQLPKVIYIGLPKELLTLASEKSATETNSRRIVAITSPQKHKDNPTLIRMLAELSRREPEQDWRLDIAGGVSDSAWEPLKQLAEQEGVKDRIVWHGFCDHDQLTALLQSAQCLVSASQLESFAMVPLEAMARGCPPVVADCTSMPESIGSAGLLVSPGNPQAFASAVQRIAYEPNLRQQFVEEGDQWIRQFQWSTCGQSFATLIERIAKQDTNGEIPNEPASSNCRSG